MRPSQIQSAEADDAQWATRHRFVIRAERKSERLRRIALGYKHSPRVRKKLIRLANALAEREKLGWICQNIAARETRLGSDWPDASRGALF